jgi:UPF0755 protein
MARTLAAARVVRSELAFMAAAEITGAARRLEAGEYLFAAREPLWRVLLAIRDGRVLKRTVTIAEGLTARAAVDILARTPALAGEASVPPEGSILPQTYEVRRGQARADVLAQMIAAHAHLLDALWQTREANLPYKSPQEAVILASIVEKETAKPDERPQVARVYLNRLARGMRLESDPTVIYGLTGGAPLGHGLRVSELAAATGYNTYRSAGLPPTPICNPGRASLEAALHPSAGDDLYFVADGTGGHVFSATLVEHLKNVARWRRIEAAAKSGAS